MDDIPAAGRVYLPEYGPLDAVLGFVLFYTLVGFATRFVVDALSTARLGIEPDAIGTWAALLLWVMLGLTVLGQAVEQARSNPHTFDSSAERDRFLQAASPSRRRFAWWGSWVVVGALVTGFLFGPFLVSFQWLLQFILGIAVAGVSGPPPRIADAFRIALFFLGYALLTAGLDRLLIGAVRSLLAGAYLREK